MDKAGPDCVEREPGECHRCILAWRDEGCVVIDVRTAQEFASGHIEDATNIDFFSPEFRGRILALERQKPYVVYCRTGVRGGKTLSMMRESGFMRVINVKGGIDGWRSAGLPTT